MVHLRTDSVSCGCALKLNPFPPTDWNFSKLGIRAVIARVEICYFHLGRVLSNFVVDFCASRVNYLFTSEREGNLSRCRFTIPFMCSKFNLKKVILCLDVGANQGYYLVFPAERRASAAATQRLAPRVQFIPLPPLLREKK
jgi:hypothetical protein